jgi:hypothetical protein
MNKSTNEQIEKRRGEVAVFPLKKTNEYKAKSQTNNRTYLLAVHNFINAQETARWLTKFNKASFLSILRLITTCTVKQPACRKIPYPCKARKKFNLASIGGLFGVSAFG